MSAYLDAHSEYESKSELDPCRDQLNLTEQNSNSTTIESFFI